MPEPPENGLPAIDGWEAPDDLTAREVCELALPEGQEILGKLGMAAGRLVIGGDSGDGKTTAVMGMVGAVAHGTRWLDWRGCGGTVLVFDLEQGLRTVQRRLKEAHLDESEAVRYYRVPDGLALDSSERQASWLEGLVLEHRPVMVVVDPLYKAHTGDSNDERAMIDLMRRFDRWRDEHGFWLVIPMHLRKMQPQQGKPTMNDVFGSGSLVRGAEMVLGIKKTAPGHSTLYFWKDRDGDLSEWREWKLLFSHSTGFERDPQDIEPPVDQQIRDAFLSAGGAILSVKQIEGMTGASDRRLRDKLKAMVETGEVEQADRVGRGGTIFYRLGMSESLLGSDERWSEE